VNWYDTDFDPMQVMEQLEKNQLLLNQNQKALISKIQEQDKLIDTLIKGQEMANRANEIMLKHLLDQINTAMEKANG
jgi:hypothetical protein